MRTLQQIGLLILLLCLLSGIGGFVVVNRELINSNRWLGLVVTLAFIALGIGFEFLRRSPAFESKRKRRKRKW